MQVVGGTPHLGGGIVYSEGSIALPQKNPSSIYRQGGNGRHLQNCVLLQAKCRTWLYYGAWITASGMVSGCGGWWSVCV